MKVNNWPETLLQISEAITDVTEGILKAKDEVTRLELLKSQQELLSKYKARWVEVTAHL